ncbi:tetratricopeptide repeat protein [Devosia sp.]|uniref:tetratricopeptide repeat protein n=1 Tax=Devosia sp. TaxID=1871048 RepID=UPI00260737C3|nr:tetratricopeptide repeat protein [Devosia sp.]
MTHKARLAAGVLLAACLTIGGAAALESSTFPVMQQSVTGSYLAGRQALSDLRTEDAARYFRSAAQEDWDNPIVVERSFIAYAANGQVSDAARTAKHLLELSAPNDLASLIIGTEDVKERRYAAAAKELENVGGDTFAGITGGILRAWALVADGKADEASKVLDGIGQGGLEDFLVFHRALMADVEGKSKEALDFAAKAYETDPNVARIVEAYTRMLGNAGRFDEAEKVIAAFEAQGLDHPLVDAVKASIDQKQRPGVFAADVQSGAAEMFHSVGVALAREGSPDIAAVFLRLGMYLDPKADVIDLVYGQLLDGANQHDAANAVYDAVPADSPMKPMAVVRIAENLDAMGDRDEALRRLGNIVTSNPKDLEALSVLGDMQRAAEKYADAADTYTKALGVAGGDAPGDWRFYYVRGISFERDKHWDKAEADFKRALELNPEQPQVLNYLGYSWVDQGINLIPALDMIQKAVAASPNDGYIIDSLGWAYFRLGRFDEAVQQLELAVQLRSTDPEINDHLGDAYWRAGRKLEAKFQWNIAAAVDQEGNVKARVAKKLANGLDAVSPAPDPGPVAEGQAAPTP